MQYDWPTRKQKSLRHRHRFLARVRRRYFRRNQWQRKYVCVRRLIGRKRTVNFRSHRLWRHFCRFFNNHVKITGNHVMFARFVLLAVSEKAKTWLPLFSFAELLRSSRLRFRMDFQIRYDAQLNKLDWKTWWRTAKQTWLKTLTAHS